MVEDKNGRGRGPKKIWCKYMRMVYIIMDTNFIQQKFSMAQLITAIKCNKNTACLINFLLS